VFFLNHFGLWLVLLAAGLGASDRQREIMRVPEGGVEWRSISAGELKDLDVAIRLDDFVMEEYPAQLALVDPATGQSLPPGRPPYLFQIDPKAPAGQLPGYQLEVLNFLPQAHPLGDGGFVKSMANGGVQAAMVKASDLKSGEVYEGWLTSGNGFIGPQPLRLGGFDPDKGHGLVLAMTKPEPRLFLSKVKVFAKSGQTTEGLISVNHPLRLWPWLIYQRDYDTFAGPISAWSGFELVKDRWLYLAYVGFILWSAGCLGMIFRGR
jgi:hypothetical protein